MKSYEETWDLRRDVGFTKRRGIYEETWDLRRDVGFSKRRGIYEETWDFCEAYNDDRV